LPHGVLERNSNGRAEAFVPEDRCDLRDLSRDAPAVAFIEREDDEAQGADTGRPQPDLEPFGERRHRLVRHANMKPQGRRRACVNLVSF
jgi:hypothetical protein